MNTDNERTTIESLEEKNRLLLKIITLQDEVNQLNKKVSELTEQLEILKNSPKEASENSSIESASETGNPKQSGKKNCDRYTFDGATYKKNRLVLAVIKKYAELNQGISAEKLMEAFPKSLQGSLGTVRLVSDVKKTYSEYTKRFFMADQELIETPSGIMTVCSQWHDKNIVNFINHAESMGMQITKDPKYN